MLESKKNISAVKKWVTYHKKSSTMSKKVFRQDWWYFNGHAGDAHVTVFRDATLGSILHFYQGQEWCKQNAFVVFVHSSYLISEIDWPRGFIFRENGRSLWYTELMNSKLMCSLLYNFRRHCLMPIHCRASLEINTRMWIPMVDINWVLFLIPEQNCWCWERGRGKNAFLWTAQTVRTCWKEII